MPARSLLHLHSVESDVRTSDQSEATRRYLVAYDISEDRRRTRVARRLQSFGDRVQYSVFVVDLRPARLVRLRTMLEGLIDGATDSVLLCDLGPVTSVDHRRFEFLGCSAEITPHGPIVL